MNAAPQDRGPRDKQEDNRVAAGCPVGAGYVTFGAAAPQLLDNGYAPLPIKPGTKVPRPTRWTSVEIDEACVDTWQRSFSGHGIGLRTDHLVGLDIDVLDPDQAHELQRLAELRFGATLLRVGLWPKRLLMYRAVEPFQKLKSGKIEILGQGQQFVAFGRHPDTGQNYYWPDGDTPLDVALADLPLIDRDSAASFLAEAGSQEIKQSAQPGKPPQRRTSQFTAGPVRDASGLVIDGRDGWLSAIAFHAVHDALGCNRADLVEQIVEQVWDRFQSTTDLERSRKESGRDYTVQDAWAKVCDKLRLAEQGRLPGRDVDVPAPDYQVPTRTATEGRADLNVMLETFCESVRNWQEQKELDIPALGIRASVGLGKTKVSRDHVLNLASALKGDGLPHRVLVFTPSHTLAEETAVAWRAAGAHVAVLRGFERNDPVTGAPMCRDIEAVRAAITSGLKIKPTVCSVPGGPTCRHFHCCAKQQNLRDVAAADVVVAPYDALFSGLAFEKDDVALLLIDEGCWARALESKSGFYIEDFASEPIGGMGRDTIGRRPVGAMADLVAFRQRVMNGLRQSGPGPVNRKALLSAGLTAEHCQHAASLERWRKVDPQLQPDLALAERAEAFRIASDNARIELVASIWQALARLLMGTTDLSGQLRVGEPDSSGRHALDLRQVRRLHDSLRGKPILHLDATMRGDLIRTVLPDLKIEDISVAAPHMHVRHVSGSFGKSMLCSVPGLPDAESARRRNRLQECVDYVRWQARRVFPARVLLVTYKSIEAAFTGIPNVETAHFNAVAGLDIYKDVGLLISIGRPLPSHLELEAMAGAYFGRLPKTEYQKARAGIQLPAGQIRGIDVIRCGDDLAETLRAAICDDELLQVVGRGRGVNRTAQDPLEVHVLADVALPLEYSDLTSWEAVRPDIVQQMLLAGIAVNSPGDVVALYPEMFSNEKQAQKEFERAGFKRQIPIYTSYREMSLKSAAYRKPGRGRGWQRAWWVDGDAETVRSSLEAVLGGLDAWKP